MIPVIDIFAGPGGLAEGFSSVTREGSPAFSVRLSVEFEDHAFRTLRLRAFYRQFPAGGAPDDYYRFIQGEMDIAALYAAWPVEAARAETETLQLKIGIETHDELDSRIGEALAGRQDWVLIGGPPCQAYSNAGLVGNRTNGQYSPRKDERYFLYQEYIRIIATHKPAAFVLENVPGMLAAKLDGERIIGDVLDGLADPGGHAQRTFGLPALSPCYRLFSLTAGHIPPDGNPRNFIVRSETLGLPQARHRVIIVGLREDIAGNTPPLLQPSAPTPAMSVLRDLPALRSALSKEKDDLIKWRGVFNEVLESVWVEEVGRLHGQDLSWAIRDQAELLAVGSPESFGGDFIRGRYEPEWNADWYSDPNLGGCLHHMARPQIRPDLHRYLYAACFAHRFGRAPKLWEYPESLLPAHRNARSGDFKDRFRTVLPDQPSGTVISHLAKDGHAFIHPDPGQCRSLTPREAARLQTFPDNYYFFGGRAAQFRQIGNAVPPWMAYEIAKLLRHHLDNERYPRPDEMVCV